MAAGLQHRLVLLPGIDGTGRLFRRLEQELVGRLDVHTLAYPIDTPLRYPALIERVVGEIGPGPVVLLGESFSGPIAIEIAARRPDLVCGLILAATFATSPVYPFLVRIGARIDLRYLPRSLVRFFLMSSERDPELATEIDNLFAVLPRMVLSARLEEVAAVDARAALARITCPVLVLHGLQDYLVRPAEAHEMLALQPAATSCFLSGPHTLLQTRARQAAGEIVSFATTCHGPPDHRQGDGT